MPVWFVLFGGKAGADILHAGTFTHIYHQGVHNHDSESSESTAFKLSREQDKTLSSSTFLLGTRGG